MNPSHWLRTDRIVRFGETDAAGVMHFHHLLRWCHEAYEDSLRKFGIPPSEIFPGPGISLSTALPIVHCSADYKRPLACGDEITIRLDPHLLDSCGFEVTYQLSRRADSGGVGETVANGVTRHRCIDSLLRKARPLPARITGWLAASDRKAGI